MALARGSFPAITRLVLEAPANHLTGASFFSVFQESADEVEAIFLGCHATADGGQLLPQ